MNTFSLHPATRLGPVSLTVSDLARSTRFYTDLLGFRQLQGVENRAYFGANDSAPLLVLTEEADARPKPPHTTGLYHFAILTPSRRELARSLRRLMAMKYPLQGASDHLVSEALYLSDPDGNGIEIYADRPRETWRKQNGQIKMATVPLHLQDLLKEVDQDSEPWEGLSTGTKIGHVHLHVADLQQAETFYRDLLGFDLITHYGRSASFVSVGGYHHHIGMNTWMGGGAPPPPPNAVGLRHFTIQLPNKAVQRALEEHLQQSGVPFTEAAAGISLHDPSHNNIIVTVELQTERLNIQSFTSVIS